ncbi:MerR family transcriptional regulator [Candidatus Sumerlaeota bacterium]|nr:MerR family transcriptional regulator [Candidatus Sumerlaeota bacterium]
MRTHNGKNYPDKLFYKIQEVSDITGVKPYVLRYWETEFPTLNPEKDERDQRRYRKSDIELILQIKHLLYEERYTIAGARQRLQSEFKKPKAKKSTSSASEKKTKSSQKQLKKLQQELRSLRSELQSLINFIEKK